MSLPGGVSTRLRANSRSSGTSLADAGGSRSLWLHGRPFWRPSERRGFTPDLHGAQRCAPKSRRCAGLVSDEPAFCSLIAGIARAELCRIVNPSLSGDSRSQTGALAVCRPLPPRAVAVAHTVQRIPQGLHVLLSRETPQRERYNGLFAVHSTRQERYRSGRNGGASKASCRVTGTWVRIPPSPPFDSTDAPKTSRQARSWRTESPLAVPARMSQTRFGLPTRIPSFSISARVEH